MFHDPEGRDARRSEINKMRRSRLTSPDSFTPNYYASSKGRNIHYELVAYKARGELRGIAEIGQCVNARPCRTREVDNGVALRLRRGVLFCENAFEIAQEHMQLAIDPRNLRDHEGRSGYRNLPACVRAFEHVRFKMRGRLLHFRDR